MKNHLRNLYFAFIFFSLSFAGCSYRHEKDTPENLRDQPGEAAQVSYQEVQQKVFSVSCVSCHGNSGGVNLESFSSVKKEIRKIEKAAVLTKQMPPGRPLRQEQLTLLAAWIGAGAPEHAPTVVDHTPTDTIQPTFASIKRKIFEVRCLGCHSSGGTAASVALETEKDLFDSPRELVVPGNPQESALYTAVSRQDDQRMPPPAYGAASLTTEEIIAIKQWIVALNGATPGDTNAPTGGSISYPYVREKILEPKCIGCHGNSGGVNLERYSEVKKNLSAIGRVAIVDELMPPNGSLSRRQRDILSTWILAGAPETPGEIPPPPAELPPADLTQLSYALVRDRIFTPKCVGCHGTSGGLSLDSYVAVKEHLGQISIAALVRKVMPPSQPLLKQDADLLSAWIRAGAPQNLPSQPPVTPSPAPSAAPSPVIDEPLRPLFSSIKSHLFEPRCFSCHRPGGIASGVLLQTRKDLINSPRDLVLPGNTEESGLLIAVTRNDDKRMPPAYAGKPALSESEIGVIRQWIMTGAPE